MRGTKSIEQQTAEGVQSPIVALPRQTPGIRVLKPGKGIAVTDDVTPKRPSPKERALAGTYRLIHGRIAMPRTPEEMLADPMNTHPIRYIEAGAVIEVGDEEAARLVDAGLVEPASTPAAHSRLGRVWEPPAEDAYLARMRQLAAGATSSRERYVKGGGIVR